MKRLIRSYRRDEWITEEEAIKRILALREYIKQQLCNRTIELNSVFNANEEEKYLLRKLQCARREYTS